MTTTTSRSALEFMRRHGLRPTPRPTSPVFDAAAALVHTVPLDAGQINAAQMLDVTGNPSPDRGITDIWPPDQEVSSDDAATTSES